MAEVIGALLRVVRHITLEPRGIHSKRGRSSDRDSSDRDSSDRDSSDRDSSDRDSSDSYSSDSYSSGGSFSSARRGSWATTIAQVKERLALGAGVALVKNRSVLGAGIALLGLAMTGCSEDDTMLLLIRDECSRNDAECFTRLKPFAKMDLSATAPASSWDYVELREAPFFAEYANETRVKLASGELCATATDATACAKAFAALQPSEGGGFAPHAHPLDYIYYMAANVGDRFEVIDSVDGLRTWLGPIDAAEDALLLVTALGYWWRESGDFAGGMRTVSDGYELIVYKVASLCDPVQTDRIKLLVSSDGSIEELDRETAKRDDGWCG